MITFRDHRTGDVPIRHMHGFVLAWKLDDHITGLRTYFAQFNDGRMARSMQVDIWGKRIDQFDFVGQRWLIIPTIPDSAKFIGYRLPPDNVQKAT